MSFTCNFSGRGIQFLLDVIEYPVTTNVLRADWRSSVKRFLLDLSTRFKIPYEAHIDTCTSDLSRLRRAEGTINQTSKAMAYHMLTTDGTAIDPHHFLSLYRAEKIESFSEYEHRKVWWVKFPHLTVAPRRYISEGAVRGERNAAAYAAAISCLDMGVSKEETLQALRIGNKRSASPLDESELRTILGNALKRKTENAS